MNGITSRGTQQPQEFRNNTGTQNQESKITGTLGARSQTPTRSLPAQSIAGTQDGTRPQSSTEIPCRTQHQSQVRSSAKSSLAGVHHTTRNGRQPPRKPTSTELKSQSQTVESHEHVTQGQRTLRDPLEGQQSGQIIPDRTNDEKNLRMTSQMSPDSPKIPLECALTQTEISGTSLKNDPLCPSSAISRQTTNFGKLSDTQIGQYQLPSMNLEQDTEGRRQSTDLGYGNSRTEESLRSGNFGMLSRQVSVTDLFEDGGTSLRSNNGKDNNRSGSRKNSQDGKKSRKNSNADMKTSGYLSRKNSQCEEHARKNSGFGFDGKRSDSRKSSGYEVKSDIGSRKNSHEWNFPSVNYNYYHSRLNVLNADDAKYKSRRNSYDLIRDRCLAILNMDSGKRKGRRMDDEAYQVSKIITVFDNVGKKQGGKFGGSQGVKSGNGGQCESHGKNGDRRGKDRKEKDNEKIKKEKGERNDVEERFVRSKEKLIGIIGSPKALRKKLTGEKDGERKEQSVGDERKQKDKVNTDVIGDRSKFKDAEKHIANVHGKIGDYVKELKDLREKKDGDIDKLMKMEKVIENVKIQHAELMEEMKRKVNEQGDRIEVNRGVEQNIKDYQLGVKVTHEENVSSMLENIKIDTDKEDVIENKEAKLKTMYNLEKNLIKTQATIEHQEITDEKFIDRLDKKKTNVHHRNSSICQSFKPSVDFKPSVPVNEKIIKIFDSSYFVITKERSPMKTESGKENNQNSENRDKECLENLREDGGNMEKLEGRVKSDREDYEIKRSDLDNIPYKKDLLDKDREYESMAHEILKSIDNMGSDTQTNGKHNLLYEKIEEEVDIEIKEATQNVPLHVDKREEHRSSVDRSWREPGNTNKTGIETKSEQLAKASLGPSKALSRAEDKQNHSAKALKITKQDGSKDITSTEKLGEHSTFQSSNQPSETLNQPGQERKLSQYEQIFQQNQKLMQKLRQYEKQPRETTSPQQYQDQKHTPQDKRELDLTPQQDTQKWHQPKTKLPQQLEQDQQKRRSQQTQGVRTSASTITKLSKSSIQEDMLEIWLDHQKFLQRHPEDDSFYSFLFVFFAVFASFVFVLIVYFVMFVV